MVSLLSINYSTRFCTFFCDTEEELIKLPTHERYGQDTLSSVSACAFGSIAKCGNGKTYVLNGEDKWTAYTGSSSGGSDLEENIEPISEAEIENLFK